MHVDLRFLQRTCNFTPLMFIEDVSRYRSLQIYASTHRWLHISFPSHQIYNHVCRRQRYSRYNSDAGLAANDGKECNLIVF
jgi:hypothetical protein